MGKYAPDKMTRSEASRVIRKVNRVVAPWFDVVEPAGSYRRGEPVVGDLDFIVLGRMSLSKIPDLLADAGYKFSIGRSGKSVLTIALHSGNKIVQVEFNKTRKSEFGAALLHSTGPGLWNVGIRTFAKQKGFKLSQHGLENLETGRVHRAPNEAAVFSRLGMRVVPPKERTNFWNEKSKYKARKIPTRKVN